MKSELFLFNSKPAFLDVKEDVLMRIAFEIVTWQGNSDGDEYGGWWHFDSGILEHTGELNLYTEVTSSGYELGSSVDLGPERAEELAESPSESLPRVMLEVLIEVRPESFQLLEDPAAIPGYQSDEFKRAFPH